ncbi:hypothetical protein JTE90_009429 [Oedothorax gibbosus]|uniref:Uncharacterized protein n=1 Tax=Oedothorax gibbosus TaxID=931172 RepID=A0AAV6VUY1_9ARAC|nr:hypothetical protein JTE90_009429 [Oedothorax gibbosus]
MQIPTTIHKREFYLQFNLTLGNCCPRHQKTSENRYKNMNIFFLCTAGASVTKYGTLKAGQLHLLLDPGTYTHAYGHW